MKNQNYKIMAYITAYEDRQSLMNCVQSLKQQSYPIHTIFIIDNSKLYEPFSPREGNQNIIVEHHPENIGISGGLKLGIQYAIQHNFDFLWAFDQDSEPQMNSLHHLLTCYEKIIQAGKLIGIISPLAIDYITGQKLHGITFNGYKFVEAPSCENSQDTYECDVVITSGSLISVDAAKNVPFPDEKYFIDAVDWEYCMKLRKCKYEIFVVKSVILKHRFGNSRSVKTILRKRSVNIYDYSPLRYYYMCRNHTFLETRLSIQYNKLSQSIKNRFTFLFVMLGKIILYEKESKCIKIWACIAGTFDGIMGRLGKRWNMT